MIAFRFHRGGTGTPVILRVLLPSAPLAEARARLAARQDVGERAGHQLSHQIAHVQGRAVQYVVLAEGVARSAWRIEAFLDFDRHRNEHVVQTPVARSLGYRFDRSADVHSAVDAPQIEPSVRRLRKRERGERRNLEALIEGHRTPCEQDRSDVDDQ